ncbi:efflux RND transporter permease subunit [Calycomorphotria hydatis]|uniref:MMPL family protein n=1 Tax=Calycomorphotria hydatis TaxID=2528027 RepID=A0A517TBL1_9PLAN|nr:MMPL family transporter [Calycomorphotria hydatis]QDT65764.1 MMPL family protein [Calycomorphotria hydatis]
MTAEVLKIRFFIVAGLACIALPFFVVAGRHAIHGTRIAPERWLPVSHPVQNRYVEFMNEYESHDIIFVSWDDCTVDDPRLTELTEELSNPSDPERAKLLEGRFERIESGASLRDSLESGPLDLNDEQVQKRLGGSFLGDNGQTTCAMIVLTPMGNEDRTASVHAVADVASDVTGLPVEEIHLCGPPTTGVPIDEESIYSVRVFGAISAVVSVLLCRFCVGSWVMTGAIAFCGLFGQMFVLGLVEFSGIHLDAVLIALPSTVFVLVTSAGIHFSGYYFYEVHHPSETHPAVRAYFAARKPTLLAAGTTAVGLGSLYLSQVGPVRSFGVIGAVGVMVGALLILGILPGLVVVKKVRIPEQTVYEKISWFGNLQKRLLKHAAFVAFACTALLIAAGAGVPKLTTAGDVPSLFSEQHKVIRDHQWFEDHIGPVVPLDVIVRFPEESSPGLLREVMILNLISDEVATIEGCGGVISAATFAPPFDPDAGFGGPIAMRQIGVRLNNQLEEFQSRKLLLSGDLGRAWRLSLRASMFEDVSYQEILDEVQKMTYRILREQLETGEPETDSENDDVAVEVTVLSDEELTDRTSFTGIMPLVRTVEQVILEDLFTSFLTAVALVSLVLIFSGYHLGNGLLAMLPNVFPVMIIFGMMGWLGFAVDIGAMMTASVALGIAIDDTVHLMHRYRQIADSGREQNDAVYNAVVECGLPMLQTTVVCGLGILPLALSPFMPTRWYAFLMCSLLATALLGDLIYLPSLLARWRPKPNPTDDEPADSPEPEETLVSNEG